MYNKFSILENIKPEFFVKIQAFYIFTVLFSIVFTIMIRISDEI